MMLFFFFQAEDGIRDIGVTGVQTCALPISDGVYLQARMEPRAECMPVPIGATPEGGKELVGFQVGLRESAQSWRELLVGLKARGLAVAPEPATGDGALGFRTALEEIFPATRHQRCWVHKTSNVLNKPPKSVQPAAKRDLREILQRSEERRVGKECRFRWSPYQFKKKTYTRSPLIELSHTSIS